MLVLSLPQKSQTMAQIAGMRMICRSSTGTNTSILILLEPSAQERRKRLEPAYFKTCTSDLLDKTSMSTSNSGLRQDFGT